MCQIKRLMRKADEPFNIERLEPFGFLREGKYKPKGRSESGWMPLNASILIEPRGITPNKRFDTEVHMTAFIGSQTV